MRKRNNIFAEAFKWIKAHRDNEGKGVKYQKDLAALIGVSEDTITRIMRDQTDVTDDFLCKFNEAFDNIFNYQWLRGEDDEPMLAADLGKSNPHQSAQTIDESSQINAAISAYIQLTNRLTDDLKKKEIEMEERLAEKDARIADLQRTIADKEDMIKSRDSRIITLERQLAAATTGDLSRYPFTVGAAEYQDKSKM
jgi:transcriptional regulator with XRE-family HTH domain